MKMRVSLAITALIALFIATGAPETLVPPISAATKHLRFGLVIPGLQNEIILGLKQGVEARAKEVGNIEVLTTADYDPQVQVKAFEDYLAAGVDALIFDSMDTNAITPAVKKANAAHVPVIGMYAGSAGGKMDSFISSDPRKHGVFIGNWLCKTLNGKGKVSIVEGNPGDEFITKMRDGVTDTIKACGLDLAAMAPTNFDRQKALQVATDQLTAHPDLNGMYCAIDDLAIACHQAIKSAGRASGPNRVVLAGHNASCEGLSALLRGDMDFTVAQLPNPIGRLAVDTAMKVLKGEQVPKTIISTGYPLDAATAKAILAGTKPNPEGTDILARLQRAEKGCK